MSKEKEIVNYSIEELFSSDSYVIPIYQRNYAWGGKEITQLIRDIADYVKKNNGQNYYIGTLIVWERKQNNKIKYETIDGQQRLTTLSILLSLIKKEYTDIDLKWYKELNLEFYSRKSSTKTLMDLFEGKDTDNKDCDISINQGYEIIKVALPKILAEKEVDISIKDFCSFLFKKVNILRVLVPEDTDLNHYFEIMNSRGEQLEKHEYLKGKMLEVLDERDRYVFNLIWEACSNMERYVQYGFTPGQRDIVFGDSDNDGNKWNSLSDWSEVYKLSKPQTDSEQSTKPVSIIDLIKPGEKQFSISQSNNTESPERFNTIIDFSNFLLHILKIQTGQDISLDDKQLIEQFEPFYRDTAKNKEFVIKFGYNLLKGKFLFDKYIIKREFLNETNRWSLKRLKCYEQPRNSINYINSFVEEESNDGINREILLLLSMFHVTTPTPEYKHWLYAALKFVFENSEKEEFPQKYKEYLEGLAKAFLYDRFLIKERKEQKDYHEIIYTNNGVSKNKDIDKTKLDAGINVDNFIFNYLDYLLWQNYQTAEKACFTGKFKNNNETLIHDERIERFEYTFRSSVEHYYPQNPIEGNKQIDREWLDNFGNLCLISSSKNSRLSNYMPNAKKEHYNKSPTIDSIKQRIMMEYEKWNIEEIEEHGNKMKELLLS